MIRESCEKVGLYAKLPKVKKLAFIGKVSEPDYKLIRNRIIGHGEGGIKGLVTNLLIQAGWDPKRDERNIFTPVIEHFMQTPDINLGVLTDFAKHKKDFTFLGSYMRKHTPFNLKECIASNLKIAPVEALHKLIDELWTVTTCVNQVGVGPGEICLTVLTNAVKGNRGDLIFTDIGDVEVKSTYGRLGSGDNALLVAEKMKTLFESRKLTIADVRKKHAQITGKPIKDKNWTWNESVQSFFFYDWGFTIPTIVNAFASLSPQRLGFSEQSSLCKGIKQLMQKYNIVSDLWLQNRDVLVKTVLAIQLCAYQAEHKFPYMLCVNKVNKDACPIYFNKKTLEENLVYVYDQFLKVNPKHHFSSNLSIDSEGTRKGVEINFK